MASVKERVTGTLAEVRERRPFIDHLLRMQEHYGAVKAGQQAGAVTYFGFLSFFPILALAFFVVGQVAAVYPGVRGDLLTAINEILPGLVGNGDGEIPLTTIEDAAAAIGIVGLLGVVYAGLGWLSAMRDGLVVVFETPAREQPGFVAGKLRDLMVLAVIGVVLIVSVAVVSLVGGFSEDVLGWVGLGTELAWLVKLLTVLLGLAANAVLFLAMFTLLAEPHLPRRSLVSGAIFGAVGFEVLKQLSTALLAGTKSQPAFQAFGIALILVVWINYFSRVVLYSAAFAHTSPQARALRVAEPADPVQGPHLPSLEDLGEREEAGRGSRAAAFAVGAATGAAAAAAVRRSRGRDDG